jgi:hypothetical protein
MDSDGGCPPRPEGTAGQSLAPASGAETGNPARPGEEAAVDTFLDLDESEDDRTLKRV